LKLIPATGKRPLYNQWQGLCLETQSYPNSVNVDVESHPGAKDGAGVEKFRKGETFILQPNGEKYDHKMVWSFGCVRDHMLGIHYGADA
jgi:galactose mutarotase-like enzyme